MALQRLHKSTGAAITMQTIELPDGAHYGRVVRDQAGRVEAVVQSKDAKDRPEILAIREINTGAYCFDAPFLADSLPRLTPSPVTKEIYITDLIQLAREQGRGVEALIDPDRDNLLGINSRAELAAATQTVKRQINARHMDQGVTLIDPESTYIETGVSIGRDTVIYPNVYLQGDTVIGENCVIEVDGEDRRFHPGKRRPYQDGLRHHPEPHRGRGGHRTLCPSAARRRPAAKGACRQLCGGEEIGAP